MLCILLQAVALFAAGTALAGTSQGPSTRLGDADDFAYLETAGGGGGLDDANSVASTSSASTSNTVTHASSLFARGDTWTSDRRAPSTVPSRASPFGWPEKAKSLGSDDFLNLPSGDAYASAVAAADETMRSAAVGGLGVSHGQLSGELSEEAFEDTSEQTSEAPSLDTFASVQTIVVKPTEDDAQLPTPGVPLEPPRDPPKNPELPRAGGLGDASVVQNDEVSETKLVQSNPTASPTKPETKPSNETPTVSPEETEKLKAFDAAAAAERSKGGGFVFSGGAGHCPGPSVEDSETIARTPAPGGPLSAFTNLGADVLFVGDSTDKLLLLSGCSASLPETERCDPGMSHLGIPSVTQVPHNMRPFVEQARDAKLGYSMLGADITSVLETQDATGCCAAIDENVDESKCCMTTEQARTSSACFVGAGAAGHVHVFGPGDGPYSEEVSDDVAAYDGYGMPRATSERAAIALERFRTWAAARRQSKRVADDKKKKEASLGTAYGVVGAVDSSSKTRPITVVINTNFWAQKFWDKAELAGDGDVSGDAMNESPEQGVSRIEKTHAADLRKYQTDMVNLVTKMQSEASGKESPSVCVVLRTQHDMILTEADQVANKRRTESNARTRAINKLIEKIGLENSIPVFPWATIFNERLAMNIFDGWCHQWGDTSLYMQRRFNSWAKAHLPKECFGGE